MVCSIFCWNIARLIKNRHGQTTWTKKAKLSDAWNDTKGSCWVNYFLYKRICHWTLFLLIPVSVPCACVCLDQLCPTQMAYWAKKYVTILTSAAHWMVYFYFSKLNLAQTNILKVCECNCNGNRHDKVVLRTTCIKNVKFKIIKTRTGCQYVGYFYYNQNLNWAAHNPWLDRMRPTGWT